MNHWLKKSAWLLAGSLLTSPSIMAANEYSASFKGTDIQEFINIVGRNLEKTIIVDPSVRGKVDVRSYDMLTEEQYYSFFLNVLEVYGYAVIEMENGVIKVVKSKDAKTSAIPVVGDGKVQGDEVVTRVVAVRNVSVRELSPLLRQLNDNAGAGNVVHYDPANIILITGRAAVVNRLADIIKRVDQAGDKSIEVVELDNASAAEMVRIVEALSKTDVKNTPGFLQPKLVADERTNSILISGDPQVRQRLRKLIKQLDVEMASKGNNRVVYLKYANAEELVDVLKGVSDNLQAEKSSGGQTNGSTKRGEVMIAAHPDTNALVLTAPPDIMIALQDVIAQLDIRRAQVLIEALIVEMAEGDGINLGVQWGSLDTGAVIQYGNTGAPIGQVMVGLEEAKDTETTKAVYDSDGNFLRNETTSEKGDYSTLASALAGVNGAAVSLVMGDWTALLSAVATDSNSNILSSPSITVMDNGEASFIVGEEVPVITGSTAGSNNDNPFQTVDRKEVGIKLKVVPQINEGNSVQLNIEQEVSNVLGANGAVDVRFAKRQLNTSVMVEDGQMIVLGGLIDERALESESKVPLLGDIPVLGHLFKSTSTQVEKKNLMVFIKPTIIRDGVTADGITQRKYNFIRAEQLYKADQGLKLMSDSHIPVLPKYGEEIRHPAEIQAFLDQIGTQ
ncbi:type II secretion system secretin GspD [Vibrio japonicus]|uniref:Type II secretion system secretin GspD n=1 Tax=Vibrio japonicus TaxID=1824638 RepID=A0ABY5LFA9_9VIBR|nr:type II secretion system secretin GspD [Vibrio japonicus]UUM30526.1 type II secretion system secretin GspD [Vibrio japonicus]